MLTYTQRKSLLTMGVSADLFGQPISVGDYVLCKSYGSPDKDHIAQVIKVNRKTIQVMVQRNSWTYGRYVPRPASHTGDWAYYPDRKFISEQIPMNRNPFDTIRIPSDFKAHLESAESTIVEAHPEAFI